MTRARHDNTDLTSAQIPMLFNHVQPGARQQARLTIADPKYGLSPERVREVLDFLGLLDDTTVPEA